MAPSYGSGRRGPNIAQFLRELNTPQAEDKALGESGFAMDDDLDVFANTNFFDVDLGQNTDFQASPVNVKPEFEMTTPSGTATATAAPTPAASTSVTATPANASGDDLTASLGDLTNMDFLSSDFNFGDYNNYHTPTVPTFHENLGNLQSLQPNPLPQYGTTVAPQHQQAPRQHPQPPQHAMPALQPDAYANPAARADEAAQPPRHLNFEDQSRMAAEEDKRRRNTAASARFRVKKKQREQALEKSAKDMSDKVSKLESRINLLETENRWLKNLVMEKNHDNEEITTMFKEFDAKHKLAEAATGSSDSSQGKN